MVPRPLDKSTFDSLDLEVSFGLGLILGLVLGLGESSCARSPKLECVLWDPGDSLSGPKFYILHFLQMKRKTVMHPLGTRDSFSKEVQL